MEELNIICIGSGSDGNCYLVGMENEFIMIECGLPYKTIIKRMSDLDITIDQIKGLCISHSHKDHSLSINEFESLGIPVFAPYRGDNTHDLNKPLSLTNWIKVRAFSAIHDVPCFGFIFLTKNKESLLFLTDTRYMESNYFNYKYTYIMIECNHIRKQLEAIMDKALIEGDQSKVFKFKRQASYHLSLAGVKKTLKGMDLSETKAIFLLHLSKDCCNDDVIKKEVAYATSGIRTLVCYREGRIN